MLTLSALPKEAKLLVSLDVLNPLEKSKSVTAAVFSLEDFRGFLLSQKSLSKRLSFPIVAITFEQYMKEMSNQNIDSCHQTLGANETR